MGINYFIDVGRRDAAIPDRIGIHHDSRTMLALIQTSGHVGANAFLQPAKRQLLLELGLQLGLGSRIAAPAWMPGIPLVAADEQVPFELRHDFNVQDFKSGKSREDFQISSLSWIHQEGPLGQVFWAK